MRKFIDLLENDHDPDAERLEAFRQLAAAQRGAPEMAMLRVQNTIGGGVLSVLVEHIGDLTHRMAEMPDRIPNCGYEFVKPKVEKGLRYLRNEYGFAREHEGNMRGNANYRNIDYDTFMINARKVLHEYAAEHRKLKVYNVCQALARDAAIALGEQDWRAAERCLSQLDGYLVDRETFKKFASQYQPGYCDYALGAPGRYGKVMEKVEFVALPRGNDLKVWRQPRRAEFDAALRDGRVRVGRGLVDRETGDMLVWNAMNASHHTVCDSTGIDYEESELIIYAESIETLDNESDWSSGAVHEIGKYFILSTHKAIPALSRVLGPAKMVGYIGTKDNGDFGTILYSDDQSN